MRCKVNVVRSNAAYLNPYRIIDGATYDTKEAALNAIEICKSIFMEAYNSEGIEIVLGLQFVED